MTVSEALEAKTGWNMRMLIANDAIIALSWRDGIPGVTMSSRMLTAAAHSHSWGKASFWALDHTPWLGFGRDPITGESHCVSAGKNDCIRAAKAIKEILGDPVVVEAFSLQEFRRELLGELQKILGCS